MLEGWTKRKILSGAQHDEKGVISGTEQYSEVYECNDCGVGHTFLPDTSEADIEEFLSEHEHGDVRLPPDHPEKERVLTAQQRDEALNG